jgi:hypothetical protein
VKKKISLFIISLSSFAMVFLIIFFQSELSGGTLSIGRSVIVAGWALSIVDLILLRKEKKKGTVSKLLKAAFAVDMIALIWSSLLVIQIIPLFFFYHFT